MKQDATMTIGDVARQVGLKTSAIRFYEKVGVLPEPVRVSGQRRYSPDTVRRLRVLEVASSRLASCPRSTRSSRRPRPSVAG